MRTLIRRIVIVAGICSAVPLARTDSFTQDRVSTAKSPSQVAVSQKRIDDVKAMVVARFDGIDKAEIQVMGAPKGSTAVGAVISETASDLALVKDPCNTESAKRPVIFATPYEKKKVGEFVCTSNRKFDKVEVEQR